MTDISIPIISALLGGALARAILAEGTTVKAGEAGGGYLKHAAVVPIKILLRAN